MSEHSLLPFHVEPSANEFSFSVETEARDGLVAIVGKGPHNAAQGLADALFIVRACNSHDDLLAALKKARAILHGDICQQYADCVEACEVADAAIKNTQVTGRGIRPASSE